MFLRLQLGLLLNTGEKLHAKAGKMKELTFKKMPRKDFVSRLGIPQRRYAKETLCAQICINSFSREKVGTFARTRYEDLDLFFDEYQHPKGKDLEFFDERQAGILDTLDALGNSFASRAMELKNRSYILSVYLLYEVLSQNKNWSQKADSEFVSFALLLWRRVKEEARAGFDRDNRELYSFDVLVNSAPGERYQIGRRHDKMLEYYEHFRKTGKIKGD
jgi:hypothetical protein